MVALVFNQLAFRFFQKFVQQISAGGVVEAVQSLSALVPMGFLLGPYFYGVHSQAPSRKRLTAICSTTVNFIPDVLQNTKRAWFTDTLDDVNGVATTIRKMAGAASETGGGLFLRASRGEDW